MEEYKYWDGFAKDRKTFYKLKMPKTGEIKLGKPINGRMYLMEDISVSFAPGEIEVRELTEEELVYELRPDVK
jgi:hypothetical protein